MVAGIRSRGLVLRYRVQVRQRIGNNWQLLRTRPLTLTVNRPALLNSLATGVVKPMRIWFPQLATFPVTSMLLLFGVPPHALAAVWTNNLWVPVRLYGLHLQSTDIGARPSDRTILLNGLLPWSTRNTPRTVDLAWLLLLPV